MVVFSSVRCSKKTKINVKIRPGLGQSEINRQWQRAPLKLKSYLGGSGNFFLSLGKSAPSIFDTISPSALRRRRMSYELEVGKIGSTMWDKNYYYYLPEKLFSFNTARVGIESVTQCDQIGPFLKGFGNAFHHKRSSRIIWPLLVLCWKTSLFIQKLLWTYFIPISGHTDWVKQ